MPQLLLVLRSFFLSFDSSINRYQILLIAAYWDIYVREKTADTIVAGGTMAGEFTGMWQSCHRGWLLLHPQNHCRGGSFENCL
jgi:hypothetical protein